MRILKFKNSEKGIAIIFALGIISMLFVIALGFVTTSIVEKQTGENFNELEVARLVAQSGLQRVIAAMTIYSEDTTKNFADVFSKNEEIVSDDIKRENLGGSDGLLQTEINDVVYYSAPTGSYNVDSFPTWQYLPFNHSTDTPIIARFAYLVLENKGKIDPSASVDSGVNASNNSVPAITEKFAVTEETSVDSDGDNVIGRPGRNMNELFLKAFPSNWINNRRAERISATNADPAGRLPTGTRWIDFDYLMKKLGLTNIAKKNSLFDVFFLSDPPAAEAFWVDSNSDSARSSSELYHRFNLTRTDWNDVAVDSVKLAPVAYPTAYTEASVTSIPWLQNWNSAGDMGSITACQNQIIANLIDYNDSDNIATTDEIVTTTAENFEAEYVGIEKCPYINEVKLIFAMAFWNYGKYKGKYLHGFNFKLQNVAVELVNMYGDSYTSVAQVYVDYDFKYDVEFQLYHATPPRGWYDNYGNWYSSGIRSLPNRTQSDDLTISTALDEYNYQTYNEFDDWAGWVYKASALIDGFPDDYINPRNFSAYVQINKIKVKLRDSVDTNKFYDFSFVVNGGDTKTLIEDYNIPVVDPLYTYKYFVLDYEVNDPRQNLLPENWEFQTQPSITDDFAVTQGLTYGSTLDEKNNNCDLPIPDNVAHADSDPEPTATDPWDISTAYIRNAPMLSPWELGFIHRGNTWQTINLKKYNSDDYIGTGGGEDYDKGDANILDQIKMTSNTETYGKICINSNIPEVLSLLLQKINVGSDVGSVDGPGALSGNEVNITNADLLAQEILVKNSTNGGTSFSTRAQILRNTNGLTDALCYDVAQGGVITLTRTTDATQEEIIGKFINLTTAVPPNAFTVLIIAQSMKDIGIAGSDTTVNVDGVDCKTGRYDEGGDQILATQKILATVVRNTLTGKFHILTYRYIGE